jgi:maltose alpha-D-glucosyltransferase/alpha-amylase
MGDNVYLGDRNGVRTPMQWSSDRNAGFSRADPARLFAPVIMDPVYGYESINVEAQERSPFSLLHWMKRMIALRRQHPVFGRGSLQFIQTRNRKVFVYVRRYEQDIVLCVANLSRTVQPAAVPLAQFAGLTPVELLGQTEFPRIDDHPYFLTLAPYGFYWFQLQEAVVPITARTAPVPDDHAALPSLFVGVVWDSVLDGGLRSIIERQALVPFLERQRWFGGKARPLAAARFVDWTTLRHGAHPAFLTIVEAEYRDGGRERYVLPLAMSSGREAAALERERPTEVLAQITGARKGLLHDGLLDDGTCQTLLGAVRDRQHLAMKHGSLQAANMDPAAAWAPAAPTPIVHPAPDQSNSSVLFGQRVFMKVFRRIEPGANPDLEIGEFLTQRGFPRVPPLLGSLSYVRNDDEPAAMAMLHPYVFNQGNGWQVTVEELARYFDRTLALPAPAVAPDAARAWAFGEGGGPPSGISEPIAIYLTTAEVLGRRTGELHMRLADAPPDNVAFAPERLTADDLEAMARAMRSHAVAQFEQLAASLERMDDRRRDMAKRVLSRRDVVVRQLEEARHVHEAGGRIRCHGDFHLGQVIVTEGDVMFLDFEGEPARPLRERRAKCSPLRDVAGMLRSFSYAALTGLGAATATRHEDVERLAPWADVWETWVTATYLRAYRAATQDAPFLPPRVADFQGLLQLFTLDKALYELGYELNNRPDWVHIPLTGLLRVQSRLPLHA